eukprot:4597066-Amphidinium_carterae.2
MSSVMNTSRAWLRISREKSSVMNGINSVMRKVGMQNLSKLSSSMLDKHVAFRLVSVRPVLPSGFAGELVNESKAEGFVTGLRQAQREAVAATEACRSSQLDCQRNHSTTFKDGGIPRLGHNEELSL